jgi:hypothetical protein
MPAYRAFTVFCFANFLLFLIKVVFNVYRPGKIALLCVVIWQQWTHESLTNTYLDRTTKGISVLLLLLAALFDDVANKQYFWVPTSRNSPFVLLHFVLLIFNVYWLCVYVMSDFEFQPILNRLSDFEYSKSAVRFWIFNIGHPILNTQNIVYSISSTRSWIFTYRLRPIA